MRYLVTLISIIYSINCFSQTPNPDLYQTWYLYDYYSTEDNIHHPVSAITPTILPSVTFTSPLSFNGSGACNSFGGTFTNPSSNWLVFNNFYSTTLVCNSSSYTSLEGSFFSLFRGSGQYYISGQGNSMSLTISNSIFVTYVFGNTRLYSPSFDSNQTIIYPNPTDSNIYVDSQSTVINKIEILNSIGQTVKTVNTDFNIINIVDLPSGIYLIKLFSEGKTAFRKIIKK
jgi:heat shock protein HslJ